MATLIDSARSAFRLGKDVTLVYRRDREDMPAFEEEILAAEKEGVKFMFMMAPKEIKGDRKVKEIVLNLKGDACVLPKQPHPFDNILIIRHGTGANRSAGCHQRGGLLSDDLKIDGLCNIQFSGFLDLQDLSLAHLTHRNRNKMQDVIVFVLDRPKQTFGQDEVTNQDCNLVFPDGIYREEAAALVRLIHHIIVYEGCSMQ